MDEVLEELSERKGHLVQNFRAYLAKHRHRIVNYDLYQSLGLAIGSGSVESTVKRIGARVKLSEHNGFLNLYLKSFAYAVLILTGNFP